MPFRSCRLAAWFVFALRLGATPFDVGAVSRMDDQVALKGIARMTVARAVCGAMRRLAGSECQRLFDDLADQQGRPPSGRMTDAHITPFDALAGLQLHVCVGNLDHFGLQAKLGEILVIHELAHSLGLGENPPSSKAITIAVMRRCG